MAVTPNRDHLTELIGPLGLLTVDQRKDERLSATLSPFFRLARRRERRALLSLNRRAVGALVAMGPAARHAEPAALADRVRQLPDPAPVRVAVTLSVFEPLPGAASPAGPATTPRSAAAARTAAG